MLSSDFAVASIVAKADIFGVGLGTLLEDVFDML